MVCQVPAAVRLCWDDICKVLEGPLVCAIKTAKYLPLSVAVIAVVCTGNMSVVMSCDMLQ